MNKFKGYELTGKIWGGDKGKNTKCGGYYACGEQRLSDRDICVNISPDSQLVLKTTDVIKLLKKYGRI